MRILITSDNHLGYKETDPLLSLDSFRAFEEILQNSNDCDFMINAGDLFHSNKPSRFTMYKTIRLLRENIISNEKNSRCMIDGIPLDKYDFEDCRYNKSQAVDKNSQTDDKNPKTGDKNSKTGDKNSETGDKNSETGDKNSKTGGKNPKTGDKNPQVNMKKSTGQNQLKNLKLPILVINGNHDDPCGFGSLSALDVLHETRLVNYVGRNENIDNIVIKPIIITEECGNNRLNVAIYFLSHVRDTRLFRLFAQNRVYFEESDCDISILVVHQNRIERTGNDNLSMDLIPEFFNLIIFGHEHDPLIMERRYQTILQCGSTVRTSCCDGEVGNKYYYKLDITLKDDLRKSKFSGNFNEKLRKGQNYDENLMRDENLKNGENYDENLMRDENLRNGQNMDDHIKNGDNSSDLKVKIDKFPLKCVRPFVYETISIESNVEIVDKLEEMIDSVQKCDSCPIDNFCDRCKPLIRLRIFTQEIINKLPFQNEFNNRVANPGEMLHIMKRKESKNDQMDKNSIKTDEKKKQDTIVTFQDIFLSVLKNTKLNIIPEYLTAKKVDEFIEKENKMAITEMVDEIIQYSNLQTLDENMVSKKSNIEEDKEFAQNVRTDLNKKYISYFNSITDTDFYSQAQQMGLFEEELTQSNTQIQETDKIKEIEQGFLVDESDDFSNLNQKKKLNVSGHFDKSSYKMENMAKVRKNDRDFLLDEEINDKGFLLDEEINDKGFLLDEEINDKGFLLDEEDKKKHEKKSYKWSDLI